MKEEVIRTVRETRIIAIIRGFSPDECLRLAEAYREGGIRMVEVTFNQRDRSDWANTAAAIRMIGERFPGEVFAGAGTVLTAEQLKIAADAGAGYIITPSLDVEIVRAAVDAGLVAMPGAFTPTEIAQAYAAGASFVKVFPAVSLGPAYIKAIRAPLSHIPLLAVGGITPENIGDFTKAGCVGAGVGGVLADRSRVTAGDWAGVSAVARRLVENAAVAG
jgi:2-dehydro-3-deoxyphosphogluconate aldolase/(4S)-4-hydroxy-2-oxoglutarate aldolase